MIDIDKAVIAKLKVGGTNLEIYVDCDSALEFKKGKKIDLNEIIASDKIFFDAKKGMLASESKIEELFPDKSNEEVIAHIIKKGDVQVTAEHKNKEFEEKKKKILQLIHVNCIDTKTGNPHPLTRIELAMEEAKVRVDVHKTAEQQLDDIVGKLRSIIPIRVDKAEVRVIVPAEFAAKGYPVATNFGKIKKDDWQNDGSWYAVVEMPAGLKNDFIDEMNKLTKGEVDVKIL